MTEVVLTRRAPLKVPRSFDASTRTVEVVWTTGAAVTRVDLFGERWVEVLEVSPRAVDLSRLNAGAPVLNAHAASDLRNVIGTVERAWIEGGEGRAVIRFSDREDVAPIVADIAAGIIRNVSVGYSVEQWREEDVAGVLRRTATRWTPHELSLVPIPADAQAQVRAAPVPQLAPAEDQDTMTTTTDDADALRAERARCAALATLAREQELGAHWLAEAIEGGTTLEAARAEALARLAARRGLPGPPSRSSIESLRDEGDTIREGAVAYLAARLAGQPITGPAERFRGMRLLDVAAEHARATRGLNIRPGTPAPDMLRLLTTSDVPLLAQSSANRALQFMYPTLRTALLSLCGRAAIPDFRPVTTVRLAQHEPLAEVAEGGPVEARYPTVNGEVMQLTDYANSFPLSERVLINDDLNAIGTWLRGAGQAAATRERLLVAGLLTAGSGAGPTMSDGLPWFHASRGNIATSAALDSNSLDAAVQALRTQRDAAGQTVYGLEPGYLIVSPSNEAMALRLTATASLIVARNEIQPFAFAVIVEPALTGNRWWVAAKPETRVSIAVGYLDGVEQPRVETFTSPDVLGTTIRVTHRLAAGVVDPIGWVTNAGG